MWRLVLTQTEKRMPQTEIDLLREMHLMQVVLIAQQIQAQEKLDGRQSFGTNYLREALRAVEKARPEVLQLLADPNLL